MNSYEFEIVVKDILPLNLITLNDEDKGNIYFTSIFSPSNTRYHTSWRFELYPRKTINELRKIEQNTLELIIYPPVQELVGKYRDEYIENRVNEDIKIQELPNFFSLNKKDIEFGDRLHIILGDLITLEKNKSSELKTVIQKIIIPQLSSYKVITSSLYRTHKPYFHLLEHLNLCNSDVTKAFSGDKYLDIAYYLDNRETSDILSRWFKERGDIKTEKELIRQIRKSYEKLREITPFNKKDQEHLVAKFSTCKNILDDMY